jgi:predicted dithiol-disulfide oxidoreductase (DUF899 family)
MRGDDVEVVSPAEWVAARKELLAREQAAISAREALNAARRRLPMVKIEKDYVFDGPDGKVRLADLFDGRRQLIVYHFMFDPSWDEGCRHCSFLADNIGHPAHLHARDTTLVIVSRAPFPKIAAFRERMGWATPWYSSFGSDFNYDFHVTQDEAIAPVECNYKDQAALLADGEAWLTKGETAGLSVFLREDDNVFHTYSSYDGEELLYGTYNYLDLTPLGRQEGQPGRPWLRHHDRYGA